MKKILLNNPGLKILSFVLAVLLWLVVANIENPVTTKQFREVPVQIINENALNSINKVYEVASGETANFTVKGRRSVLDNLTASDFEVIADLAHLSEVNAVQVEITPKNENSSVEIYKNSNTLTVSLEDEKQESFSVTVATKGSPAKGYALGETLVSPNIVDVTGPKSLINRIETVSITVDVNNVKEDFNQKYNLHYYDEDGEEVDVTRISSSVKKVAADIQILRTKEITVAVNSVGEPAQGYSLESLNFEPQTVTIAGTSEVLQEVNQITINDVDIYNLNEDKEYAFKVADYVPKDVVLTEPEQKIMVKVNIGQITTRKMIITEEKISIAGGIANYNYNIDHSTEVEVTIKGFSDVINNLNPGDLSPMIDVSGLSPGLHTCSLSVTSEEDVELTVSNKVKVRISK